jgi:hypothetical protein
LSESLESLKSWLEDVIVEGDPSGRTNIFNSIDSYSSSTLDIGALGKLPYNITKLFNRGFLVGFLEAIGEVGD